MTTINQLAANLTQAEESLASITGAINAKAKELATEQTEAERLDSLVLLKGDTQAMLDLVASRATINGIETHIKELTRAQSAASARRDEAEAELLETIEELGEVEGHLSPEEVAKATAKLREQVDKYAHELFKKVDAHNGACAELTELAKRAKALKGEQPPHWEFRAGNPLSLDSIHEATSGSALERFEAPRLKARHEAWLKDVREAADIQRESVGASALMLDRVTRAADA